MPYFRFVLLPATIAVLFLPPSVSASAYTRGELLAQLASFQAQLQALVIQVNKNAENANTIRQDLQLGDEDPDVLLLQRVLNTSSITKVAESGYGAPGAETSYFGQLTYNAVLRFQEAYRAQILTPLNLATPTGFVGPATRAVLNSLLSRLGGSSSGTEGDETRDERDDADKATSSTVLKAPSGFHTSISFNRVRISWGEVDGATEYRIERTEKEADGFEVIDTTDRTEYTDRSVEDDTTYFYTITARNDDTESEPSEAIEVDVPRKSSGGGCSTSAPDYDIYVDSETGSDSNSGTGPCDALATLGAAQTAATAIGDGASIGLARGSYWREELRLNSLESVTVAGYGEGNLPIIDGAETVEGWEATDGTDNVYETTVTFPTMVQGNYYTTLLEDGEMLTRVADEATVEATPASFYTSSDDGTATVMVHATNSTNAGSNGKMYQISYREVGLYLGDYATVRYVHTKNQKFNDGSLVVGYNSTIEHSVAENGHYHNALAGGGSTVRFNTFKNAHRHDANGFMLIIYSRGTDHDAPAAEELQPTYIRNNVFVHDASHAPPEDAVYGHTNGSQTTDVYMTENRFQNVGKILSVGGRTGDQYFEDNVIIFDDENTGATNGYLSLGTSYVRRNEIYVSYPTPDNLPASAELLTMGGAQTYEDNVISDPRGVFGWIWGKTSGTATTSFDGNIVYAPEAVVLYNQSSTLNVDQWDNNHVVAMQLRHRGGGSFTTSADNNQYGGFLAGFQVNDESVTWDEWQAAGRDEAGGFAPDVRVALVRPGSPQRDGLYQWPVLVHISADAVSGSNDSITGVTNLADTTPDEPLLGSAIGSYELYEPTPGTDKVERSLEGGTHWLSPVANGGLTPSSSSPIFDTNTTGTDFVAVVRLNEAFGSTTPGSYLTGAAQGTSNPRGLVLGSTIGNQTGELITLHYNNESGRGIIDHEVSIPADTPFVISGYVTPNGMRYRINGIEYDESFNTAAAGKAWGTAKNEMLLLRGIATDDPAALVFDGNVGVFVGILGSGKLPIEAIEQELAKQYNISL